MKNRNLLYVIGGSSTACLCLCAFLGMMYQIGSNTPSFKATQAARRGIEFVQQPDVTNSASKSVEAVSDLELWTSTPGIATLTTVLTTKTLTPEPTSTPMPRPTNTLEPEPTNTPTSEPTNTPIPRPTNTSTPKPTSTPIPRPTDTPIPKPTNTPIPRPTNTPVPQPTRPPAQPGNVQLVQIYFDGQVPRVESDEYAVVRNIGGEAVNIGGWRLNAGDTGQDFVFPDFTLQPGQECRVYTNESHAESCGFSFGSGKALWNNGGDCGYLFDSAGQQVSSRCY